MTPSDAAELLELPPDATAEQIETRFFELRAKLEDKIAKAPTPGLKEKYRATLNDITEAFEVLTIAADSSTLPLLAKPSEASAPVPAAALSPQTESSPAASPSVASSPSVSPPRKTKKQKSSLEFILVAVMALVVLGAGGWWVMKTRAENAEKALVAAAAKAEAERKAESERLALEAQRQAEEAERERKEKLTTQLRTRLAELRIDWEILEKQVRTAERELEDLKRALREATENSTAQRELAHRTRAFANYTAWLESYFERHAARLARVRAEELLSARETEAAAKAVDEVAAAITAAGPAIKTERERLLALDGSLQITSTPSGLAWKLTDNFGRTQSGITPTTIGKVAPGNAAVMFSRAGFKDVSANAIVATGQTATVNGSVVSQTMYFTAEADVQFYVDGKFIGRGRGEFANAAPKKYTLEMRRANFPAYRTPFEVKQIAGTSTASYSFADLAKENQNCPSCSGRGSFARTDRCSSCHGRGTLTCDNCDGRGYFNPPTIDPQFSAMRFNCQICGGDGRVDCRDCTNGKIGYTESCSRCGGDGRVSRLQLSQ